MSRLVSLQEASYIFRQLPMELQVASLHPKTVSASSIVNSKLQPLYWCYEDGNEKYIYSFHMTVDEAYGVTDIQSPYGYGGPLSTTKEKSFLKHANAEFERWCVQNNILAEFVALHPLVNYAGLYKGKLIKNRMTVWIDLEKDLFSQYQSRRRSYIRRNQDSDLLVRKLERDEALELFVDIYYQNMIDVNAEEFYFFSRRYLRGLFKENMFQCWGVFENGVMLAGATFFISPTSRMIEYHLGAKKDKFDKRRSMMFLIHSIASHFKEKGFSRFYLGGGRSTEDQDSLLFFKKGFSKELVDFYIGYRIFDNDKYNKLKSNFHKKRGSGKVLFYKD